MNEEDLVKTLAEGCTIDDLQDDEGSLSFLVDIVGLERTVEIAIKLGGILIYVPKRVKSRLMEKYVINHYNGQNSRALALKLGLSERTVYRWASQRPEVAGVKQRSLFEEEDA